MPYFNRYLLCGDAPTSPIRDDYLVGLGSLLGSIAEASAQLAFLDDAQRENDIASLFDDLVDSYEQSFDYLSGCDPFADPATIPSVAGVFPGPPS